MDRRAFLSNLAVGSLAAALPNASAAFGVNSVRVIEMWNTHPINGKHERVRVPYWRNGDYDWDGIAHLNYFMRDWRDERQKDIDPDVYDILYALQSELGGHDGIHLISGYRSPQTNAMLRRRSSGVAKYSKHLDGRAADIRIPGVPLSTLRRKAVALREGGVGYYTSSNFVHVDNGRVRQW